MYDVSSGVQSEEACKPCKPDYEKKAAQAKKDLDVFIETKAVLLKFVGHIGRYSARKNEASSLPEFIGRLELDIQQKNREFDEITRILEQEA